MSTIADVMTKNPITIHHDASVVEILDTLSKCDFDHLPVVNSEERLVGMISKSDLYKKTLVLSKTTTGKTYTMKQLEATKANDIMTARPLSISPEHSLALAVEILLQSKFHALPVVSDEVVVGVVTAKDLLGALQLKLPTVS